MRVACHGTVAPADGLLSPRTPSQRRSARYQSHLPSSRMASSPSTSSSTSTLASGKRSSLTRRKVARRKVCRRVGSGSGSLGERGVDQGEGVEDIAAARLLRKRVGSTSPRLSLRRYPSVKAHVPVLTSSSLASARVPSVRNSSEDYRRRCRGAVSSVLYLDAPSQRRYELAGSADGFSRSTFAVLGLGSRPPSGVSVRSSRPAHGSS